MWKITQTIFAVAYLNFKFVIQDFDAIYHNLNITRALKERAPR